MAETAATAAAGEVDLLLKLTEDRGELMNGIREKYFAAETGPGEAEKRHLFEVTELFSRTVYLIHEWAESCRLWTTGD